MHRFVLAEFNTHRVFSRNSASSRARPVQKVIDSVVNDTAFPVEFGSNQAGMQAGPPLVGGELVTALDIWEDAAHTAVQYAENLMKAGVHKQVTNRLLEPFMWHTVIVTATDYDNFYLQRCSPLAQPEIRVAAEAMCVAHEASTPVLLQPGEYHLPYIYDEDRALVSDPMELLKISVARCARVSYLTQNGVRDISVDIELYDRLVTASPPHYSPMEHVATPDANNAAYIYALSLKPFALLGNFPGWSQLRHQLYT